MRDPEESNASNSHKIGAVAVDVQRRAAVRAPRRQFL